MSSQTSIDGYTVAYEGEEIYFPVYVVLFVGAVLLVWAFAQHNPYLLLPGGAALGFAYHNYPLLENGRPRLGAGQYGLFVEGLGVIAWRAVKSIELVAVSSRGTVDRELRVTLAKPLEAALIADWRKRPIYRILMRLPWSMRDGTISIPLEVFDRPPDEIHRNVMRLWRYFRA
jgi:hypothetical protein